MLVIAAVAFGIFMGVPAVAVIKMEAIQSWVKNMLLAGAGIFWLACVIGGYFLIKHADAKGFTPKTYPHRPDLKTRELWKLEDKGTPFEALHRR